MTDHRSPTEDLSAPDDLLDEAVAEIGQRLLAGHVVDVEEIIRRFPGREEQIRQLLPAVQALAGLRQSDVFGQDDQSARQRAPSVGAKHVEAVPRSALRRACRWLLCHRLVSAVLVTLVIVVPAVSVTTYCSTPRMPADSPAKGNDMRSSTAAKVATAMVAVSMLTSDAAQAGKPAPPPSLPVAYQLTDIGSFPGGYTNAFSLTKSTATVVGTSGFSAENQGPFVWSPSMGIVNLNALSPDWVNEFGQEVSGWSAAIARDINNEGLIVGSAFNGEETRAFLLDLVSPDLGFQLLPNPAGSTGNVQAFHISDNGNVLIRSANPDWTQCTQYLWTPSYPLVLHPVGMSFSSAFNDDKFLLFDDSARIARLYSYAFEADGTLDDSLIGSVGATQVSDLNDAGWFTYREDNATYGRIKIYRPGMSTLTVYNVRGASVTAGAAIGNSGDCGYEANGVPYLYRCSEGKSYKLYDLLDSNAKAVLFPNGTCASSIGLMRFMVNSSNVASVPAADPYDHICGVVNLTADSSTENWKTIVLTPVPK